MNKVCTKCKIEKSFSDFRYHPLGKYNLQSRCKECQRIESREFTKKNPDYSKKWHENNKDKKIATHRNWKYRKYKKNQCEVCNFVAIDWCQLDVDHIDGDHFNDDPNNLQTLCANCHRLKSKLSGDIGRPKLQLVNKEN